MFLLKHLFKLREKSQGDVIKPFLDHMEDLRWTIIKIVLVLVISMVAAAWNRQDLMDLLKHPLMIADPTGELAGTIRSDSIMDSFMITLKVAFYVGIIIALPFILYFVADFVLPALTDRERKVMIPGFLVGVVFFVTGAAASYFYITPHTLAFFWHDAQSSKLYSLWTW